MKFRLGTTEVEAESRVEADAVVVTVDGRTTRVPFRRLPGGQVQLFVDDRWCLAWSDGRATWVDGQSLEVLRVGSTGATAAAGSLASPMPATVLRVLVAPGDAVD